MNIESKQIQSRLFTLKRNSLTSSWVSTNSNWNQSCVSSLLSPAFPLLHAELHLFPVLFFFFLQFFPTYSCHFTCPFHTVIPYIPFLVSSTLSHSVPPSLHFTSSLTSHLISVHLCSLLRLDLLLCFLLIALSPCYSSILTIRRLQLQLYSPALPHPPFHVLFALSLLPLMLPTSPAHTLFFQLTLPPHPSILSAQPSSFPHILLSPHLPPTASLAVSYSDSDIITLVVTGFICTLWTYTSAWLIVQGLGTTEAPPRLGQSNRQNDPKTTPACVPPDIFPLLGLICQTQ